MTPSDAPVTVGPLTFHPSHITIDLTGEVVTLSPTDRDVISRLWKPSTFDYFMRAIVLGTVLAVVVCVVYVLLHLAMRLT